MLDWEYKAIRDAALARKCPIEALLEKRAEKFGGVYTPLYEDFVLEYDAEFLRKMTFDDEFRMEQQVEQEVYQLDKDRNRVSVKVRQWLPAVGLYIAVLNWIVWKLDIRVKTNLVQDGHKAFFEFLEKPDELVTHLDAAYTEHLERLERACRSI